MRKVVTIVLATIFIVACGEEPQNSATVDIPMIAGKTQAEVAAVLGQPSTCENVEQGKKCSYQPGKTDIVFIAGKADWITVNALDDVPYSKNALPFLGLKASTPSSANKFVMRWSGVSNLIDVSIFPSEGQVSYAYIKTATP